MKSETPGTAIFKVEILNVSPHGFRLMVENVEYFLAFSDFPWFRQATLDQLFDVALIHKDHLYWPKLDIDLDLDRIQHPEK